METLRKFLGLKPPRRWYVVYQDSLKPRLYSDDRRSYYPAYLLKGSAAESARIQNEIMETMALPTRFTIRKVRL